MGLHTHTHTYAHTHYIRAQHALQPACCKRVCVCVARVIYTMRKINFPPRYSPPLETYRIEYFRWRRAVHPFPLPIREISERVTRRKLRDLEMNYLYKSKWGCAGQMSMFWQTRFGTTPRVYDNAFRFSGRGDESRRKIKNCNSFRGRLFASYAFHAIFFV